MKHSLTAEEFDVDHHWEVDVKDDVVVDGQTKQETDESELFPRFERGWVEPVEPGHLIVDEESYVYTYVMSVLHYESKKLDTSNVTCKVTYTKVILLVPPKLRFKLPSSHY